MAALGAALLVVAAVTGNFPLLIVGMLLFGSGNATSLQSRYAAADLAAPWHRARLLSLVLWTTTIGSVAGPNLAQPGKRLAETLGLPPLAGSFVISASALTVAVVIVFVAMRPDPLQLARRYEGAAGAAGAAARAEPAKKVAARDVLAILWAIPAARLGLVASVCAHTVMVMVMTMTPVDMEHHGHDLSFVGITISTHIVGMYAFSPVVAWLADKFGRVAVIVIGQGILLASAVVSGLAGSSMVVITTGLFLLGLGWSFALVAASALLTEVVPGEVRTAAQGLVDTTMNLSSAVAAGLSGVLLGWVGFAGLNVIGALVVVPVFLVLPAVRRVTTSG
jgi:MFS family permease